MVIGTGEIARGPCSAPLRSAPRYTHKSVELQLAGVTVAAIPHAAATARAAASAASTRRGCDRDYNYMRLYNVLH